MLTSIWIECQNYDIEQFEYLLICFENSWDRASADWNGD